MIAVNDLRTEEVLRRIRLRVMDLDWDLDLPLRGGTPWGRERLRNELDRNIRRLLVQVTQEFLQIMDEEAAR